VARPIASVVTAPGPPERCFEPPCDELPCWAPPFLPLFPELPGSLADAAPHPATAAATGIATSHLRRLVSILTKSIKSV
jgi:hypothetical protein